jgi:hypothetical protein
VSQLCLTTGITYDLFYLILIRWLLLALLVLSIRPPGLEGPDSAGHAKGRAAAWALVTSSVERHVVDWAVDACDDNDDQDDSAPPQPGSGLGGSDDDVLCAGIDWRISPGAAQLALTPPDSDGLGPARGHSPDTERPPRRA